MSDVVYEPKVNIINGSSHEATILCPELVGRVSLVVTSPPYHNAISYSSHAQNPQLNYRERNLQDYSGDYLPFLNSVWDQCWEMLKPGGLIAINVGSVLDNGYHYPLHLDINDVLDSSECEWHFIRSILWHKVTAGVKRAGSVIQHPYPGYWYSNIMTEHIILFRKPGGSLTQNAAAPTQWLSPIWDIAPVPPGKLRHPAPFPEEIPHRLVSMFTNEGDWVMDPFNGSGATTKAAFDLSRNALGFEIEQKYVDLAQDRIRAESGVKPLQFRMTLQDRSEFVPGKPQGKTRHGAGLASVRKNQGRE